MMQETSATTIFCEDIRREIGGQLTLVGVYQNAVQVSENDALRLALYTKVQISPKLDVQKIELFLIDPTGQSAKIGEAPRSVIKPSEDGDKKLTTLSAENFLHGMKWTISGVYAVHVHIDGEPILSGQLAIQIDKSEEVGNEI